MKNLVNTENRSVLQSWVHELPFMQQSVLITACRGPDTLPKDHVAKLVCRWLRRCFMLSAFEGRVINTPDDPGGGSFTGPSVAPCETVERIGLLKVLAVDYLRRVDEMPHHFQLHILHAAEILGYHHPDRRIRDWWNWFYVELAHDMHLVPELQEEMDLRLSDQKATWEAREHAPAAQPPESREAPQVVGRKHLTVYVEPQYGDERFCVDQDNPDKQDGTRNPGRLGVRYCDARQAAVMIEHWLKEQNEQGAAPET